MTASLLALSSHVDVYLYRQDGCVVSTLTAVGLFESDRHHSSKIKLEG